MKPFIMIMAITVVTGLGWVVSPFAESPPGEAAERVPSPNVSQEVPPPPGADTTLQFESEAYRRATPADRKMEELRLHQNTVLERFENTDDQGRLLLSFSGGKVDLTLRGANGAEAPVARLD